MAPAASPQHMLLLCSLPNGLNSKLNRSTTHLVVGGVMEMCDTMPQQLLPLPECRMTD